MGATSPISATQLLATLANDDGYQRLEHDRDIELAAIAAERARKLTPFTEELVASGIHTTHDPSTGIRSDDPQLLDIALRHLTHDEYDDWTRATIARHLDIKGARTYWDQIIALYLKAVGPEERNALAAALATCARTNDVEQLIELVQNPELGSSRIFFLRPINRLLRAEGKAFVAQLVDDPILGGEASAIVRGRSRNE